MWAMIEKLRMGAVFDMGGWEAAPLYRADTGC